MGTTTGQRIKALRAKHGFTQDDMAERLGMNRANFSNYERDVATPPADTLAKISDLLHTTSDYLLGRTEDPSPIRAAETPEWASSRDKRDLRRMLEEEEIMFDGVPLTEEDKQRVQDVLTGLFWEAKMMNKRKKPPER